MRGWGGVVVAGASPAHPTPPRSSSLPLPRTGDLKNIKGVVDSVAEDGRIMMVVQDEALPNFKDAIGFQPRELVKYFDVSAPPPPPPWPLADCPPWLAACCRRCCSCCCCRWGGIADCLPACLPANGAGAVAAPLSPAVRRARQGGARPARGRDGAGGEGGGRHLLRFHRRHARGAASLLPGPGIGGGGGFQRRLVSRGEGGWWWVGGWVGGWVGTMGARREGEPVGAAGRAGGAGACTRSARRALRPTSLPPPAPSRFAGWGATICTTSWCWMLPQSA